MKIARWIALASLIALTSSLAMAAETPDGTNISEVVNQPPSMWQRMKNGTSNAWYRSTSVFRKKEAPAPITGSRPSATNKPVTSSYDRNKDKADNSNINNVGDWLKQPRVGDELHTIK